MSDKTVSDYLSEAPKDWDYDYAKLWAKIQVSQDVKRNKNRQIEQLQKTVQELLEALEMIVYDNNSNEINEAQRQNSEKAITNAKQVMGR